jgi:hypothetical protein
MEKAIKGRQHETALKGARSEITSEMHVRPVMSVMNAESTRGPTWPGVGRVHLVQTLLLLLHLQMYQGGE